MKTSSLGRNSSVPFPDGIPQWQSFIGTQCPSCSSCPSGHRQPESVKNIKYWHFFLYSIFRLKFEFKVKLYQHDRILAGTARVPINQHSCEDTDWHSCLDRSDPLVLHSAHLGYKENQSCSSLKDRPNENLRFWYFFPQLQKSTIMFKMTTNDPKNKKKPSGCSECSVKSEQSIYLLFLGKTN